MENKQVGGLHCKSCNKQLEEHELDDNLCFECLGVVQVEVDEYILGDQE